MRCANMPPAVALVWLHWNGRATTQQTQPLPVC
jgi:hypothetical protein